MNNYVFKRNNEGEDLDGANIESMIHIFENFINNSISKEQLMQLLHIAINLAQID